jgi:molybdenum cofactor cytidylyltransferase
MRAAILLAAGSSRRFGRRDKLKARLGSGSLLDHALANVRASGACRVILVSVHPKRIPGTTQVRAPRGQGSLSASLAAGLAALRPIEREALIFLADMPYARAPRLRLFGGANAVRPRFRGLPGHPVLVQVAAARAALAAGEAGLGRSLWMAYVPGRADHLLDIDTPAALRRVRRHGSRAWRPRSAPE